MKRTQRIADGDADLCNLCRRFLTGRGYEVETTSNGLDCQRRLRQRTPSALVLDLEILWGGGDGVLAWLREENLTNAIPVILTAMPGSLQDVAELIEAPVVDYLPK